MFNEIENIKHITRLFKEVPSMLEKVLKNTCAFSVEHESVSSDQCAVKMAQVRPISSQLLAECISAVSKING